ncbi:MAG: NADH-dependent oxidoreductase, partial [Planctomycetes bacterium]|nr:NADH-dependent oxidoreductase [Planctomycetota bacterium]
PLGPPTGIDPAKLEGIVIDDHQAAKSGSWTEGTGLEGYVGHNYLYASGGSDASIRFEFEVKASGKHEVRIACRPHENRSTSVPVEVHSAEGVKSMRADMHAEPPLEHGFVSLGAFEFRAGEKGAVVISAKEAKGFVHADAVQVVPVE